MSTEFRKSSVVTVFAQVTAVSFESLYAQSNSIVFGLHLEITRKQKDAEIRKVRALAGSNHLLASTELLILI